MPETEVRIIPADSLEWRAAADDEDGPTISGYGAVFNSPSMELMPGFREYVAPGAFARSLKARGNDIHSYFNHDPSKPLGSTRAGNLTMIEDDKGLRYEVKPPQTSYVNDLAAAMAAKLVRGSSFAFAVKKDEWKEENGMQVRTLLDVDLFEVGPVTRGAYSAASSQIRSMLEARGLTLDGERAEKPVDLMALLATWQPKDEAELRAALATLTALLPSEELPPAEEPPPIVPPHRLALARLRYDTQRKLYGI
jgi:HK97 family phage prohead protease